MVNKNNLNRQYIYYGLPAFALAMPTIPAFIYLPSIYATSLGLTTTGLILLIARVVDVISDPIIGVISDNKNTRFGRRKPWIFIGSIISAIALVTLFQPPNDVTKLFLITWVILLYLGWTMIAVPYTAWGAELSNNYYERTKITGIREALTIFGILIAGIIPAFLLNYGYDERFGLIVVSWTAVLFGFLGIIALLSKVKENIQSYKNQTTKSYLKSLKTLKSNKPFIRLVTAWFINGLANGIPASLFLIYMQHALKIDKTDQSILILIYFIFGIISVPLWVYLSKIYGKHRIWCYAMILTSLAFLFVLGIQPGHILPFAIICAITGMGLGADMALPPSIQADVIDYDKLINKKSRAGICFALWSMSTKLALALSVGIAFPLLEYLGFSIKESNEPSAIRALVVIYAGFPVVLKIISVCLIWSFPINRVRLEVILRRLKKT